MKTPMQELIDCYNVANHYKTWETFLDNLHSVLIVLLEKEKQMIIEAFVNGFKDCEKLHEEAFYIQDEAEQYYNETFKQ